MSVCVNMRKKGTQMLFVFVFFLSALPCAEKFQEYTDFNTSIT